ncbi:hypothetical protein PGUG_00966 [Meyerozyma guilliermondii ATCC 6260]|uniref:Uncharacterized protein n=1 Tax=Meyerozyma guilliermondii (strain ATCC 6260 / CBS 566 / DSM 6381 / JCM 1539 / NBRC 10279 / NRRL Y-324) TaxID=294746 RepID=A5DCG1_PICGU|nr:uncharacterized protein PGUG_00966 [Meyerozyma guilliermondii ATCC 6260]EDK36868.2 hypothetical protein PGUG_00966 [Meyerozyma guilliermondii ATCC 6260]
MRKLSVPQSTTPSHKYSRSGSRSSLARISRTNTNADSAYNPPSTFDNQSLRTLDHIPSAKPSVSYSDKLWTQIDVLDDVRKMASDVRERGSFFNEKFNSELEAMKTSQDRLIDIMASQDFDSNLQQERFRVEPNTTDKLDSSLFSFFDNEGQDRQHVLYKKENFDEMNNYVHDIKVQLQRVGEAMEDFNGVTSEQ